MKINIKGAGISFLVGCGLYCFGAEGIVDASWLNARVFPELKAPVAVKLPRGKKVEVTRRWRNWLEITAPDITKVFVSAARLNGDKAVSDVNLRIRPAANGAVIGRLKANDKVKLISVPDKFGWVQIAPSAEMRLYVCRDYIKCDLSKVPVEELKKKETPVKNEVKPVAVAPAKAEVKPAAAPVKAETKPTAVPAKAESKPVAVIPAKADEKPAAVPAKKEVKAATPAKAAVKPAAPAKKEDKAVAPAKAAVKPAAPVKKEIKAPELNTSRKQELEKLNADILNPVPFKKSGSLNSVGTSLSSCTNFALLDSNTGNNQAFLFTDIASINLKKLDGRDVTVTGFSYKVSGWKAPVVQVTALEAK